MNNSVRKYIDDYINNFVPYKNYRWCYEDGILVNAVYQMYVVTKKGKYLDFVIGYYDQMIEEDGTIKNYILEEFNIDNIAGGLALIEAYNVSKKEKFLKAINVLYNQLKLHPRTNEKSFWHKKIYPNQVWMDGIYMGLVFYAKYSNYFSSNDEADIYLQLKNLDKYLYDSKRKLFVHAYDESKQMQWANKDTGKSPNVWSRACGWVAMALVDIYEISQDSFYKDIYDKLINGLIPHLYENMFFQVIDRKDYEANYLETSGSAMISYSIMKAARINMISNDMKKLGQDIFNSIVKHYFVKDGKNFHLGGICKVAGLDNDRRNGSVEYYMSEIIAVDEVKGVAPFILAYLETIR